MDLVDMVDVEADAGATGWATAKVDTTAAAARMQARSRQVVPMDPPVGCGPGPLLAGEAVVVATHASTQGCRGCPQQVYALRAWIVAVCGAVARSAESGSDPQDALLTEDMLKSGTRQVGIAVRVK
jgi:hypothetical protein